LEPALPVTGHAAGGGGFEFRQQDHGRCEDAAPDRRVAGLMEALEKLPEGNPLKNDPAYQAVAKRRYVGSRESSRLRVLKRFRALGPAISRQRQSNSANEGYKQIELALQA
jgi:hypothetical protein